MILVQLLDNGNVVATFEKSKFQELVEKYKCLIKSILFLIFHIFKI